MAITTIVDNGHSLTMDTTVMIKKNIVSVEINGDVANTVDIYAKNGSSTQKVSILTTDLTAPTVATAALLRSQILGMIDEGDAKIIDEASATVTYVGYTDSGSTMAEAKWAIKKIDSTSGDEIITWRTGVRFRNNIWNDRVAGTYVS